MSFKNYTKDGEDRFMIDACQQEVIDLCKLLSIGAAPRINNLKIDSVIVKQFYSGSVQPNSSDNFSSASNNTNSNNTDNDYPAPNHYADAARWVRKMKVTRDFIREANNNIAELARILTAIFGWVVDENQLRKALNRI